MKKILSMILPGVIIVAITILSMVEKNIFVGLFLLFPIIFIVQGYLCSNLKKELLPGLFLSSIAFIVPTNLLYHMGSCVEFMLVYNLMGIMSYYMKNKNSYKRF